MSEDEQKNDITLVWENDPQERKCRRLSSETETDWCMADAARESLREHMKLLKKAQERIAYLESLRMNEIVIGDRLVAENGDAQGSVLSIGQWDKRIIEAELFDTWCQIIIRPITKREG